MISFELSEEQSLAQTMARKLADTTIRPVSRELSALRDAPEAHFLTDEILADIASLGVVQSVAHAALDGSGSRASSLMSVLVLEELAWGDANCAVALAAPLGFVRAIAELGSDKQKQSLLPLYEAEGYRAAAVACAEPGLTTSGLTQLKTEVTLKNGKEVLNGIKALVPLGARCEHFLVIARSDEEPVAVIVAADAEGVTVNKPRYTMGCSSSELSDVSFKDVVVDPAMKLGESTGVSMMPIMNGSWIAVASILNGIARAAYEYAIEYAKERKVGGEILATKQNVALQLVDSHVNSESARWMSWRAAGQLDRCEDATRMARLSHGRSVSTAGWITDESLQVMGGHGFISEYIMESWYRNAKTVSTFDNAFGV